MYPAADPFGEPFSPEYMPQRRRLANTPIAGGYRFVLDGVQADQDYIRLIFTLGQFFSKITCCAFCGVLMRTSDGQSSEMLYTNFNPTAMHRQTCIGSRNEWINAHGNSPLVSIPGFSPHLRVFPDWMRVTDLAIAPDMIGSLLLDLTDDATVFAGQSRDVRLNAAFESYRAWCNVNDVTDRCMARMFATAILKPGVAFPYISQRTMSGTACRFAVQWLAGVMRRVAVADPSPERKRLGQKSEPLCGKPFCTCATGSSLDLGGGKVRSLRLSLFACGRLRAIIGLFSEYSCKIVSVSIML